MMKNTEKLHLLSVGIQQNLISDADILSVAANAAAKNRKSISLNRSDILSNAVQSSATKRGKSSLANVEDDDILANAVDASAKKRKKSPSNKQMENNENGNPNATSQHFEIDSCLKGSKEKFQSSVIPFSLSSPTILQPIAGKKKTALVDKEKSSKEGLQPFSPSNKPNNTNTQTDSQTMSSSNLTIDTSTNDVVDDDDEQASHGDVDNDEPEAPLDESYVSTAGTENTENTTYMTIEDIKDTLLSHLLNVINTGSFEELTALKGIGKKRATDIMTERNSGVVFDDLFDLENYITMNHKTIVKFIKANIVELIDV